MLRASPARAAGGSLRARRERRPEVPGPRAPGQGEGALGTAGSGGPAGLRASGGAAALAGRLGGTFGGTGARAKKWVRVPRAEAAGMGSPPLLLLHSRARAGCWPPGDRRPSGCPGSLVLGGWSAARWVSCSAFFVFL